MIRNFTTGKLWREFYVISVALLHMGCSFPTTRRPLIGFADADWGVDVDDRKSTTGYCIYMGSNFVSWTSHNQKTVSKSSTEV